MKTYKVNEIFYSLQGEGHWTGTPMVFVRLALCNLRCPFCDTDFASFTEMTAEDILTAVRLPRRSAPRNDVMTLSSVTAPRNDVITLSSVTPCHSECQSVRHSERLSVRHSERSEESQRNDVLRPLDGHHICLTGGEPSLQLDEDLINAFHSEGYTIHIETNGTRPLPLGIDWITCSPKADWDPRAEVVLDRMDEVKVVYTGQNVERWTELNAREYFLQPCSGQNTEEVVAYILDHPHWRLSLQTHKLLNIR